MPPLDGLAAAVLDTHVWIWGQLGDERASSLRQFRGSPVVSAISLWETSMLVAKGRLKLDVSLSEWLDTASAHPVRIQPLTAEVCALSVELGEFHGDPADRLIVASALRLGLPLLTADRRIIDWNQHYSRLQVIAL